MNQSTPAVPRAREQYSQYVRQSVLFTARRLLAQRAFAQTPVRLLAKEAGVAVQTIYSLFGSKHGVLVALVDLADDGIGVEELQRTLATSEDLGELATAVATMHRRFFEHYGDIIRALAQAAPNDAALAPMRDEIAARRKGGVQRLCGRLVDMELVDPGSVEDVAAHLELLILPETFLFTEGLGWSFDRYESWLQGELVALMRSRFAEPG